jgi:hypothetical protein
MEMSLRRGLGGSKKSQNIHVRTRPFIHISSQFYPDFFHILSKFYADFVQILSKFYPDFLETHLILILSRFYPDLILIFEKSG